MAVNRLKIKINQSQDENLDKVLIIPIPQTTDEVGRGDLIDEYERETIERLLNLKKDYEVIRYTHAPLAGGDPSPNAFYNFNFGLPDVGISPGPVLYNPNPTTNPVTLTTFNMQGTTPCPQQLDVPVLDENGIAIPYILEPSLYPNPTFLETWYGYDAAGFSAEEAYRNEKSFVKSFFKLDLYDSPIRNNQKLYISLILNPINSEKIYRPTLNKSCATEGFDTFLDGRWNCRPYGERWVPTPKFNLDPFENNDGYYIYWLKDDKFLDINEFYMSCKFYNGKTGVITSFLNQSQNTLPNPYTFAPETVFYYKVTLNRNDYTYTIFNTTTNLRVGTTENNGITFWQYINKP